EEVREAAVQRSAEPPTTISYVPGARNRGEVQRWADASHAQTKRLINAPFHGMVEYEAYTDPSDLASAVRTLIYLHRDISGMADIRIEGGYHVLPWTNAIGQLALAESLGESISVPPPPARRGSLGYSPRNRPQPVRAIVPRLRVKRYDSLLPDLAAVYEPGGAFPIATEAKGAKRRSGLLNDVKLGMTREQVLLFVRVPSGYQLITGAPGTGKTTVALQRIRFLVNEYAQRMDTLLDHSIDTTAVFVPNSAFVTHVQKLLEELELPRGIVMVVDEYIPKYLQQVWKVKGRAHEIQPSSPREARGRQAFFGLCMVDDLDRVWSTYELQIKERVANSNHRWFQELSTFADRMQELEASGDPNWHRTYRDLNHVRVRNAAASLARRLAEAPKAFAARGPEESFWTMSSVYERCRQEYTSLRRLLADHATAELSRFDNFFSQWLFWVYDPLRAIAAHFHQQLSEGRARIAEGLDDDGAAVRIASMLDQEFAAILSPIESRDHDRPYGPEQLPWIAWLLRNALPINPDPKRRFARIPRAYFDPNADDELQDRPWHHVVIDEAQDLSVAGAAFISSLVHRKGALTVSADFRQVVSPVCGIDDDLAITRHSGMKSAEAQQPKLPTNLRQSGEIGNFVAAFYESIFGVAAPFKALEPEGEALPRISMVDLAELSGKLQAEVEELRSVVEGTIAVISVNGSAETTQQLRDVLGTDLTIAFAEYLSNRESSDGRIIVGTAEEVKGFEFDGCIILGLEALIDSRLKHTANRAYVAMSRPRQLLSLIITEPVTVLNRIDETLFMKTDDTVGVS
ncbi:MAG: helicase domain-containing protein, partial [Vulcanimicrobiaceae bacterium]